MKMMFQVSGRNIRKVNTEFFIELGSPGGASKVGETNTDHPDVIAHLAHKLPDFPWDALAPYGDKARMHQMVQSISR
jgi:hypothetical protein